MTIWNNTISSITKDKFLCCHRAHDGSRYAIHNGPSSPTDNETALSSLSRFLY
ncbi:hypothetical protein WN48_09440 [Eufriesea mexicana]|uniref:Uncharacterized protein n=1 Tax=Eufriesea mexicana TaxID=516756 RepID=A0A310SHM9_9HYME|nr:hypothetical protein WN48_09440 [Eufriesea mexicana]